MVVRVKLDGISAVVGEILTVSVLDRVINVRVVSVDGHAFEVEPCTTLELLLLATSRDT